MKGLFCGKCFTIRSLPRDDLKPVVCECGNLAGWWVNARQGHARYHAGDRALGFMVGWHNTYLLSIVNAGVCDSDEAMRSLHAECTTSPGYHFDKSRKACWSIVMWPGQSSDTAWASKDEVRQVAGPLLVLARPDGYEVPFAVADEGERT